VSRQAAKDARLCEACVQLPGGQGFQDVRRDLPGQVPERFRDVSQSCDLDQPPWLSGPYPLTGILGIGSCCQRP
jgi:hypothetical protein